MLIVDALDVDINGTPILRDIGLEIKTGEIIGLIGRNGAGKTTFLRSVMGLFQSIVARLILMITRCTACRDIAGHICASAICQKTGGWCRK